ncbi:MAG TPA: Gmad2 immunoglobulin-like domain-containing protein [Nocardioidaceae bacterium]|nr:Gmad2 immunoglobulin-like domain-containing protein [Nocardioidaceae bacterium]
MDQTTPHEEWVRGLLEDAVSDVAPEHGLDSIRRRTSSTAARHGRRGWLWAAGSAVVATAATVAAVVTLSNGPGTPQADHGFASGAASSQARQSASAQSGAASGSSQPSQGTTKAGPVDSTVTVPVYFVGQTPHGPRLYRDDQQVPAADAATPAVHAALAGYSTDPDYTSPWPSTAQVDKVSADGSGITIALQSGGNPLADRPSGMSSDEATLAVQQLVYTAQDALSSKAPVSFTVDGQPASKLLGVDVSGGVDRAPDTSTEALVWVLSPVQGAKVHSPFKVTGLANAFEANVVWELEQGGQVVKQGHTTAQEAFLMSPYSFNVDAPPGDYTLVVHDDDASGQGNVTQDTKDITVLP